jgi:hypothetical protein
MFESRRPPGRNPMRPLSVTIFEAMGITTLIVDMALYSDRDWLNFAVSGLILLLILSISRLRSRLARWVYTALNLIMVPVLIYAAAQFRLPDWTLSNWIFALAGFVEIILLWLPSTSKWLGEMREGPAAQPAA